MGSLLMDTGAAMGSGVGDRIESYLERMAVWADMPSSLSTDLANELVDRFWLPR